MSKNFNGFKQLQRKEFCIVIFLVRMVTKKKKKLVYFEFFLPFFHLQQFFFQGLFILFHEKWKLQVQQSFQTYQERLLFQEFFFFFRFFRFEPEFRFRANDFLFRFVFEVLQLWPLFQLLLFPFFQPLLFLFLIFFLRFLFRFVVCLLPAFAIILDFPFEPTIQLSVFPLQVFFTTILILFKFFIK